MPATTATSTAQLTGPALIAHHAEHGSNTSTSRADVVTLAGYLRSNGRPAFTDYYEALIKARQLASPHAWHAAANPDAWHGPSYSEHQPERFALLTVTTASGEQIGASLPVSIDRNGWSDAETYETAERLIDEHASHYADAAQGPDAFPLLVSLADRSGPVTLFEIDVDGDLEDRLGDGLERCENCNAIHETDSGKPVQVRIQNSYGRFNSEQWCESCVEDHATECESCHDYYPTAELQHTGDDEQVCPPCIEEHYATCNDCGDLHTYDDCHTVDDSQTVCRHCIDNGNGDRYHYHDGEGWSTTPPDDDDDEHQGPDGMHRHRYHADANDKLGHTIANTGHTYGAELEYKGNPSDWPAIAAACRNRAILTDDSTVSGELVSAALTAGELRKYLAAVTAALTGTHNDTATGLHIHTDRRALTPWQWYTLSHYAAAHNSTLEAIAGRPSNQWADLQRLPACTWQAFAKSWLNRCWPSRYAGINFSKGPTVEWRICRATKTPERVLARFGMIQRMTALGRLTPSQRPQSTAELRGWLARDRYIASVTGWEPGAFNYRAAMMQPVGKGDQQPAAPRAETLKALANKVETLRADLRLTNQLSLNANAQRSHPDQTYATDATHRFYYYQRETDRIGTQLRQARAEHDQAENLTVLARINSLTQ